jgi:hypothetical protein
MTREPQSPEKEAKRLPAAVAFGQGGRKPKKRVEASRPAAMPPPICKAIATETKNPAKAGFSLATAKITGAASA